MPLQKFRHNAALGRNQGLVLGLVLESRLVLALSGVNRLVVSPELILRGSREVAIPNSGLGRGGLGGQGTAAQDLLGLVGVVTHELLGSLSSMGGVGAGDLAKLVGLGANELLGVLDVVVDELLVGGVDQGDAEE